MCQSCGCSACDVCGKDIIDGVCSGCEQDALECICIPEEEPG